MPNIEMDYRDDNIRYRWLVLFRFPGSNANSGRATMKSRTLTCIIAMTLFAALVLQLGAGTSAAQDETFTKVQNIHVPGLSGNNPFIFDIGFVDPVSDLYLLSDVSNKSLDVIQASTGTFLFQVPGFTGVNLANFDLSHLGPDGVLTVHHTEAWVGDGDSTVKVIDLISRTITDVISTGGTTRADEMAYDPRDHVLIVANPDEGSRTPPQAPFVSLISATTHKILKQIKFPSATGGIEQPSWSFRTGLFYVSIPQFDNSPNKSGVAVINPRTLRLVTIFETGDCSPNGSALGPDNQLLLGCSGTGNDTVVLNIRNGRVTKTFDQVTGSDEVWFNPGDDHFYVTANAFGPTPTAFLGVIDVHGLKFDGTVATSAGSHSVAADPITNHVFVPLTGDPNDPLCAFGCIGVYVASGSDRYDHVDEDGSDP